MDQHELALAFDSRRRRLRAVAYRMLGSLSDSEDAVQETWLRLQRTDPATIENLDAWLTRVIARISLNQLRDRRRHAEWPLDGFSPEPVVSAESGHDPEHEAFLSDAVGIALQVVLDTLTPPERLAFVLHDMFDMPFDEIAPVLDRSVGATRKLASRARRSLRDAIPEPDRDPARQRAVVDGDTPFAILGARARRTRVERGRRARRCALGTRGVGSSRGQSVVIVDRRQHDQAVLRYCIGRVEWLSGLSPRSRTAHRWRHLRSAHRGAEVDMRGWAKQTWRP